MHPNSAFRSSTKIHRKNDRIQQIFRPALVDGSRIYGPRDTPRKTITQRGTNGAKGPQIKLGGTTPTQPGEYKTNRRRAIAYLRRERRWTGVVLGRCSRQVWRGQQWRCMRTGVCVYAHRNAWDYIGAQNFAWRLLRMRPSCRPHGFLLGRQ